MKRGSWEGTFQGFILIILHTIAYEMLVIMVKEYKITV